jgi:hypothetical protein
MQQTIDAPAKPGRPYIGPKAQTAIWPDIHSYAREEAARRKVPVSDVWREMLEEAYAERLARGEA